MAKYAEHLLKKKNKSIVKVSKSSTQKLGNVDANSFENPE